MHFALNDTQVEELEAYFCFVGDGTIMKDIIDVDSWVNKYEIDQEHDNMYYSRSWLEVD